MNAPDAFMQSDWMRFRTSFLSLDQKAYTKVIRSDADSTFGLGESRVSVNQVYWRVQMLLF